MKVILPDTNVYGGAMEITDQDHADAYFKALVERHMNITGVSQEEAEELQRSNLGYWAGYYDQETRERVERLFQCEHPFLGKATEKQWTTEELFQLGYNMAADFKKKRKEKA